MAITSIRNIKSNLGISPKKEIILYCRGSEDKTSIIINNKHHLLQLLNIVEIEYGTDIEKPDQSATSVINNLESLLLAMPICLLLNVDDLFETTFLIILLSACPQSAISIDSAAFNSRILPATNR